MQDKIRNASGQILEVTAGTDAGFYKIDVTTAATTRNYTNTSGDIITAVNDFIQANTLGALDLREITDYTLSRSADTSKYNYTPIAAGTYTLDFPSAADRLHLKDAPYDMFCIPYGDVEMRNTPATGWTNFTLTPSLSLSIAQGIASALDKNLYDLQLVPYCPMTGFEVGSVGGLRYIDIKNESVRRYDIIKNAQNIDVCCILWSTASSGSKTLNYRLTPINYKMLNHCYSYRFVSPNYAGQFEFNAAKNGGFSSVTVDFTYLPYQPYIHVNPTFNRLYGSNFGDARGLVCSGDFSISYLSDPWREYQTRNKNYLNIFDREIENMEVNHSWDMREAKFSALAGTVSGAAKGSKNLAAFGPIGSAVGGLIGGGLAAAGGALDIQEKESLYTEAVDYKQDLFGFQLDNIKALPYSLAKVTAINENNKIFPFIESYSCSDVEKRAFANKIAWNSMTVGVIGQIQDYITNSWSYNDITDKGYIKARLIRFDDANEDFHNVNAIADELLKGVYTK